MATQDLGYEYLSHLPDAIAKPIQGVTVASGIPNDQVRLLLCLLLAIPLGELHKRLPTPIAKHVYSLLWGFLFCFTLVGYDVLHIVLSSAAVFVLMQAPYVCSAFALVYQCGAQISRMYHDYLGWRMDYSLIQMMLTVKVCTFAFCYADGLALNANEKLHPSDKVYEARVAHAIRVLPSPLEYFSYIFFFGGVLVGPCFEIREYLEFTDLTLFKNEGLEGPPSSFGPAMTAVGKAFLSYGGAIVAMKIPLFGYCHTDEFLHHTSFLYRLLYIVLATHLTRYKYYFAWYLAEAGCISSGLGFNSVTRDVRQGNKIVSVDWTRWSNAFISMVELGPDLPTVTNNWNRGVNNWLKNYVYFRFDCPDSVAKKIGVPKTTLANFFTKFISALWHGFYGGYYLFFISGAFASEFDNVFRRCFMPIPPSPEDKGKARSDYERKRKLYNIYGWAVTAFYMNYMGSAFMILRADWAIAIWNSVYWCGHIFVFLGLVVLNMFARTLKPTKEKPTAAATATKTSTAKSE